MKERQVEKKVGEVSSESKTMSFFFLRSLGAHMSVVLYL